MAMKGKNIATSAEEMRQKLFGPNNDGTNARSAHTPDRFKAYLDYIGKTVTVPLEHISIEDNVRKQVETASPKFTELVESIRKEGLLQNLIVDVRQTSEGTYLSCVSGQRRLLAAREAGIEKAVCLLKQYSDAQRVSVGLTENLIRQDLHCIDVAEGYAELQRNGWSEEEIAERFERGQRTVHRYLLIAAWPIDVKTKIREHAQLFPTRVIFNQLISRGFADADELRQAIENRISAAQNEAKKLKTNAATKSKLQPETQRSVKVLIDKLNTEIAVRDKGGKGKIEISYSTNEDLERILSLLTVD